MSKITLPNGITLDPNGAWAEDLTNYAHTKGFPNIYAFLAIHPDNSQEYLLVEYPEENKEGQPIYANQSFEDVCCHIDILWADKNMPP